MNEVLLNELIGRNLLKSFLTLAKATEINFTEDRFNPVDCFFVNKGAKVVAEIKVRDLKYKDYPTHLMEVEKFNNLCQAKKDNLCLAGMYACFFGDLFLYIYNIKDIIKHSEMVYKYCPVTTYASHLMVCKECLLIDSQIAKKYKFNKDKLLWESL